MEEIEDQKGGIWSLFLSVTIIYYLLSGSHAYGSFQARPPSPGIWLNIMDSFLILSGSPLSFHLPRSLEKKSDGPQLEESRTPWRDASFRTETWCIRESGV